MKKDREIQFLEKEDIIRIFLTQIFDTDGVTALKHNKEHFQFDEYRQRSSSYIFNKISAAFSPNIIISGLENVRENKPCFIAYPHSASILDGTLLNTVLLGQGIPSMALARVSDSEEKKSHRDLLYHYLEDYIIHLRQDKLADGTYAPISRKAMIDMVKGIRSVVSCNGAVLIAPEGKTNPYQMGEVKDSITSMSKKYNAPVIPCTIEYHQPLRINPGDMKWGELFSSIEITFHKPEENIENITRSIADGFVSRFKGGKHVSPAVMHNTEDYILNIKEKVNPILFYAAHPGEYTIETRQLIINLLEEEFGSILLHLREYLPYRQDRFIDYICSDIYNHIESDLITQIAIHAA